MYYMHHKYVCVILEVNLILFINITIFDSAFVLAIFDGLERGVCKLNYFI